MDIVNNILTKMNVNDLRIMNIFPSCKDTDWRSQKSDMGSYIIKVSRLLLADFLWRLKAKYVIKNFHPLVLFYLSGFVLAIVGLIGAALFIILQIYIIRPVL